MFRRLISSRFFRLLLLLVMPTLATAQSNLFTTLSLNPVASSPLAIASGDFNGDGRVDLAVTSTGTNAVSVLLGTGDGNFQPAVNYPVGNRPVAIVAGDFNHDGHLDLAVLNNNPNTSDTGGSVSILIGQGDGTFVAGSTYGVGYLPTALGVGDFNGDGNLDLVVVVSNPNLSFNPGFVTVLTGTGNGTFSAQANYGVGLVPVSITVGDFTGDGKLDLAVGSSAIALSNPQSEISILINDGSGGFQIGPSFVTGPTPAIPISIAAADFNGDGRLDLAVAMNDTTDLEIWQGNGDGTFTGISTISLGNNPIWVAAGDVNGDGKTDLIVSNNGDGTLSVLLGNGDETFSIAPTVTAGNYPEVLALADFNGDGKLDIAIVNNGDSNVQVLLGEGNGAFRAGTYRVRANPTGITSGDFNRDGISDLAVVNGDASVTILLADGHGGFKAQTPFPGCQSQSGITPGQIVAADFNGDGTPGLAIACNNSSSPYSSFLNLLTGKGDGTFQTRFQTPPTPGYGIIALGAADIKGDGFSDIITATGGGSVAAYGFDLDEYSLQINCCIAIDPVPIQAADFNGDGKADLVLDTDRGADLLLQNNDGSFQSNILADDLSVSGDFNGDGLTDLILGFDNLTFVAQIDDHGNFHLGFQFSSPFKGLKVADFNGDGIPDVLSFSAHPVYFGQTDGSFIDSGTPPLPFTNQIPVTGDFDGNGSPDVAVLDPAAGTVSILLNKNSFQPTSTLLSELPGNVVAGGPLTLSAAVTAKQGTPTGTVVFKQAGVPQTTVALAGGAAQGTETAPSTIGQYGYTALYTGDGTFGGSLSQRLLVNVSTASSSTVISSSDKNSNLGQSVTFTASVKPQYSGIPTGTVEFYADGGPIGTAAVSNGLASVNVSTLTQGNHTIEAEYSGDASFTASLGLFTQKVGKASSTVTLNSSLNPAVYGQAVNLTATVTDSDGIAPTGIVVFSEGGAIYGSVTLNGGVAQLTLPQLLVGKHTITAQYGGDNSDNSSKASLTETIQGASSATSITSSLNPSNYGQAVIFTATVTSTSGVPDGTVTFKNGSQGLGTVTLSGGQAQLSVSTVDAGANTVKAIYSGSSTFTTSQNSLQQVVVAAPTTVVLTASPNPASSGQAVTLTATVNCATALPTGTVTIKDGKTVLGTASVVNGQAQFTTSTLSTGTHSLNATFSGSQDFAKSNSASLQEIID